MPLDGNVDLFVKPKVLDAISMTRLKAAELLEEHGWCQGMSGDSAGRMCMGRALNIAAGSLPGLYLERNAAAAMGFGGVFSLIVWNDIPFNTLEIVLAKLREGIPR